MFLTTPGIIIGKETGEVNKKTIPNQFRNNRWERNWGS
jgi:hypothetical protein